MRAVHATRPGGPEVLEPVEIAEPVAGPGDLLVRAAYAGVNFIDTYVRSGSYPADFPHVPGREGVGTVIEVGSEVDDVAIGDRVGWVEATGSYAEIVRVPAEVAVPIPDKVGDKDAAAVLLQGITAHFLARSTYPLKAGRVALLHAGAGGVGLLLTQIAVVDGARLITTVSTDEKERLSRSAGASTVIRYDRMADLTAELPAAVLEATGGDGVHVAYDGVGRTTFDASLASVRSRGTVVLFGAASGPVPPFDPQRLNRAGSLYLTRPTIGSYTASRAELLHRAGEVLTMVRDDELDVHVSATYPLVEAGTAHVALEGRKTTGKVLIQLPAASA